MTSPLYTVTKIFNYTKLPEISTCHSLSPTGDGIPNFEFAFALSEEEDPPLFTQ